MKSANKQQRQRRQSCANCLLGIFFKGSWQCNILVLLPFRLPFPWMHKKWSASELSSLEMSVFKCCHLDIWEPAASLPKWKCEGIALTVCQGLSLALPQWSSQQPPFETGTHFCMGGRETEAQRVTCPRPSTGMVSIVMEHPACAGDIPVIKTSVALVQM